MEKRPTARGVLLSSLVLLALVTAALYVAEPADSSPSTERPDLDGPPREMVRNGITSLQATNYAFTADLEYLNESGRIEERAEFSVRIENRRKRARLRSRIGTLRQDMFVGEHIAAVRYPDVEDEWTLGGGGYEPYMNAFHRPGWINRTSATVVERSDTAVAVELDLRDVEPGTEVAFFVTTFSESNGTLTVYVDRETRTIDRAEFYAPTPDGGGVRVTYRSSDVGTTTVERPDGIPPITLREIAFRISEGLEAFGVTGR